MYICIFVYAYIYIHTHIYTHTYIHKYAYIHTYIHAYLLTYTYLVLTYTYLVLTYTYLGWREEWRQVEADADIEITGPLKVQVQFVAEVCVSVKRGLRIW